MPNELVTSSPGLLYARMQNAIAKCYSVDDCSRYANEADAIASFYRQLKDETSYRQFIQIKLRAWRRIGEIITNGVDKEGCQSVADYIRKIQAKFKHGEIDNLNDGNIRRAIKIAELPADFFERNATEYHSTEAMVSAFARMKYEQEQNTPEGKAATRKAEREYVKQKKENDEREAQRQADAREREEEVDELFGAQAEAFREVGITLDRRDRKKMHQIVFLIKKEIHSTLRQAAFDNRLTMQEILRRGLMMWFAAHGYIVGEDVKSKSKSQDTHSSQ